MCVCYDLCVIGSSLYDIHFRRCEIVDWEARYEIQVSESVYIIVYLSGLVRGNGALPYRVLLLLLLLHLFHLLSNPSLSLCSTTCIPVSIIPAALFVCTCKCTRVLCLPMPHHHHQHQRFRSVQPVFLHEALNGHESELKARCSRIEPTFLWIPWKTFLSPFRRTRVRLLVFSN